MIKNFRLLSKNYIFKVFYLGFKTNTNVNSVMYHDLDTWIQNDVLLRNDKIYSNSSIECRVPFLDQNIIENFLLVNDFKKYGVFLNYKHLIRKNFKRELENVNKAKLGFDTPFSKLLRQDLYKFQKKF